MIGILKHKLADHWRHSAREVSDSALSLFYDDADDTDVTEADFFMCNGRWNDNAPTTWGNPEEALKQQEFWAIYDTCQRNLPPKMARVFMLRELVGLSVDEICLETGFSDVNYWVTMHRARLRLRECLNVRWFNHTKSEK